jgi:hypothetical protein
VNTSKSLKPIPPKSLEVPNQAQLIQEIYEALSLCPHQNRFIKAFWWTMEGQCLGYFFDHQCLRYLTEVNCGIKIQSQDLYSNIILNYQLSQKLIFIENNELTHLINTSTTCYFMFQIIVITPIPTF